MERKKIILICNTCLARNYSIFKSQNSMDKLEIKKHCPSCNKHTLHKETR